jgi:hypothetical protein
MNATRDPEAILSAWLDEGPTDLPDATRRAILTSLPTTPQARRGRLAPWRHFDMNGFGRLAAAALVVVIAIGGLFLVLRPNLGSGTPSPSPAAIPTASTGAPAATPATLTFTSEQYGYTLEYPSTWKPVPASGTWPTGGPIDPEQSYVDGFMPRVTQIGPWVGIAAQPIPDGSTGQKWMAAWAQQRESVGGLCFGPASAWTDATVAGVAARRLEAPCLPEAGNPTNFVEYAWVIGETGYVLTGAPPSVVEQMAQSFRAG